MLLLTKDYRPHLGGNTPQEEGATTAGVGRYADIDILQEDIATLYSLVSRLESELEEELLDFALLIDTEDDKLVEAHRAEWPDTLGEPRDQVSYREYKALSRRRTTTSDYIMKRFEGAARDVAGSSALDELNLARIVRSELELVENFLSDYVGDIDDSSEFRLLELFQDWVVGALDVAGEIRQLRRAPPESLPTEEIERITEDEAKQAQTVFKVKLNSNNKEIAQNLEFLKENFSEFAPMFYSRILGPALKYRLNVGRNLMLTPTGVTEETERASRVLETHLKSAFADQMRRRTIFKEKTTHLIDDIKERDKYRSYIKQLTSKAHPLPTSGSQVMVPAVESADEVQYWENALHDPPEDIVPSHAVLIDLEEDTHPQYLLEEGGILTGDMLFEDDALLDGMRPATHRHTGEDGTTQILGRDVIDLKDNSVDVDDVPPVPHHVEVLHYNEAILPPGYLTIDAAVKWQGHARYSYEIQMAPLEDIDSQYRLVLGIDKLATEVRVPPGGKGQFMHTAEGDT